MTRSSVQAAGGSATATGRVDRLVVLRAAAYGQLLATPAALVNSSSSGVDGTADAAVALSFLAVVAGFAVAGFAAGRNAVHETARHGAIAGLIAFVPVELFAIAGRLDRGDPIRLVAIVVHAAVAATAAMAFARLGARRRDARAEHAPEPNLTEPMPTEPVPTDPTPTSTPTDLEDRS